MLSTVSRSIRTQSLRVPLDLSSRRRRTTPVPVFVDRPPPEQRRLGGHPTRSSPQPVRKESAERSPAVVVSRQLPTSKGQVSRVTRQEVAGQQPSPPSTSGSSWSAPTICRISSPWAASLTRPLPSARRRSGPASTSWPRAPRRQATPPIPRQQQSSPSADVTFWDNCARVRTHARVLGLVVPGIARPGDCPRYRGKGPNQSLG